MNATTSIKFGNKEITLTVSGGNKWEAEGVERVYFDIAVSGKANPVSKFYEVIAGTTRDNTITANGRTFGYQYGFCDSKTKRRAVDEAMAILAQSL